MKKELQYLEAYAANLKESLQTFTTSKKEEILAGNEKLIGSIKSRTETINRLDLTIYKLKEQARYLEALQEVSTQQAIIIEQLKAVASKDYKKEAEHWKSKYYALANMASEEYHRQRAVQFFANFDKKAAAEYDAAKEQIRMSSIDRCKNDFPTLF